MGSGWRDYQKYGDLTSSIAIRVGSFYADEWVT